MACHHGHDPIQCIIPPYMVDAIKDSGDTELIASVEELAKISEELRAKRTETTIDGAMAFLMAEVSAEAAEGGLQRKVYNAENSMELQKSLARKEGDPPHADAAVNEAFDGAGDTYQLFKEAYGRDSLDGKGLPLISSVHVRRDFNNAFWNGQQMAYGDGDGRIFTRFTQALTVIGHELSHGLVQFSGGLNYVYQSGALNEHIADVFGCLTEQFKKKQTVDQAEWLVGKEILAPNIKGQALRSMKAPGEAYNDPVLGKDPQPRNMQQFVKTSRDNGGVHINSGIPNHAFYLIATKLGGHAWEKAGKIWYETLQRLQDPDSTFVKFASLSLEVAGDLYGAESAEKKAVLHGWVGVGLLKEDGSPTDIANDTITNPPSGLPSAAEANTPGTTPPARGFWAGVKRIFGW
ncbi:MAG: M4 family metallopeptidase [Myxococcales bacterium]|nr:M4 family metallopeptidase [Myxococcales bacterium]